MDNLLFRNLLIGEKYHRLMPQSTCEKVAFGKGDTFFSIDKIQDQVVSHYLQTQKLSKALKAETNQSLQQICEKLQWFLYNHIQYKADGEAQLLRSPACTWNTRYDGVDCKSYTIFASAMLVNLGIKHFIRKIKQPYYDTANYSHVYVVVPIIQHTANIDQGYYIIDGTIKNAIEPLFTEKNDTYMNLPHYGLNGAYPSLRGESTGDPNTSDPTNTGESQTINYQGLLDSVDVGWLKDFIGNIKCWGGSAYNNDRLQQDSDALIGRLNNLIIEINKAVYNQDMVALANNVTLFSGIAAWNASLAGTKRSEGYNPCTTANIDAIHKVLNFFRYTVVPALQEWLAKHFNVTETGTANFGRQSISGTNVKEAYFGQWVTYVGQDIILTAPTYTLSFKGVDVPKFEISEELKVNIENPGTFNVLKFLSQLGTTIVKFTGNGSDGVYTSNNPNVDVPKPDIEKAGFGILGGLLLVGAAYGVYKSTNEKPTKSIKK